jgi:hypothetical protein
MALDTNAHEHENVDTSAWQSLMPSVQEVAAGTWPAPLLHSGSHF